MNNCLFKIKIVDPILYGWQRFICTKFYTTECVENKQLLLKQPFMNLFFKYIL